MELRRQRRLLTYGAHFWKRYADARLTPSFDR
jgi:hypothetical protein